MISPGEKEIMRRAFEAGFPQIILLENGISTMQKPSGRQFDACAEGRLLLLSPWEHHNDYRAITREQCLQLNALASKICEWEVLPMSSFASVSLAKYNRTESVNFSRNHYYMIKNAYILRNFHKLSQKRSLRLYHINIKIKTSWRKIYCY